MHLLNIRDGQVSDGSEPVDLGQSPGDIVVLSAADTDLVGLERARERLGEDFPSLRLANLMTLQHNFSVDLYVEQVIAQAKFVCVRVLGGKTYWPYGVSEIVKAAKANGLPLAMIPGDSRPDPDIDELSTVSLEVRDRLWAYLQQGGSENLTGFLEHAAFAGGLSEKEGRPPQSVAQAGLYWPAANPQQLDDLAGHWKTDGPAALIIFYRAFHLASATKAIDALIEGLKAEGLRPVPVFLQSLKDDACADFVSTLIADAQPEIVLNLTGFAVSSPGQARRASVLEEADAPILQVVAASLARSEWEDSPRGLGTRDTAMNIALPEVDGRILTRAIGFKQPGEPNELTQHASVEHIPLMDRVRFVARQASAWARLRGTPAKARRVALILANYPNRDGRLANGVGLDTPASVVEVLQAMAAAGYDTGDLPRSSAALMKVLSAGPTNDRSREKSGEGGVRLPLADYTAFFDSLPEPVRHGVTGRWGAPEDDPFFEAGDETPGFRLALHSYGNAYVGIQPARGYNIDPEGTYHDPDLPPPHGYIAFYAWLRHVGDVHAIVHLGKHGNLEWLPGKALALSENCFPEAVMGPLPHLYPFIVNDPGEGTQAKRRTSALIIDHLTPPMTRAESYGPLKDLEALVDEYYDASVLDSRRLQPLQREILDAAARAGLDREGVYNSGAEDAEAIMALDNYLCELKEMQIRDGLHIFGQAPKGCLLNDLAIAIARAPRGRGDGEDASLLRALAIDLGLEGFDPLDCHLGSPWEGQRPDCLNALSPQAWRTNGDTVERLELLSSRLLTGTEPQPEWTNTRKVMGSLSNELLPALKACGHSEIDGLLKGLDGRFVVPGPSGAPTRGRPDVLPTGRNFYSVDTRAVPTQTAWSLGWKSAQLLVEDFRQREGMWPRAMTLSAWGTSNMRTGGDDIAQAMALMGVRPKWDGTSRRVTGFEILPLAKLARPRIDVTFRVSGFFRDAFPHQMDILDSAARAVMQLEESAADNPAAERYRADCDTLRQEGTQAHIAEMRAGSRVFGSKPGAYGAGLQALIDEGIWQERGDLGEAYLEWGSYAYGAGQEGRRDREFMERRIASSDAIVQNQDNREHDLLDSDDYYQFEGGLAAAAEKLQGRMPTVYHNDHSRPETPKIRTLEDEIARVVRARAVNPKWISGVMRHGYKGAFEMAATLDYLFAFAASTNSVKDHQFDMVYDAYFGDEEVRAFIEQNNPAAYREMAARFVEALDRNLWQPKLNSVRADLEGLVPGRLQ